MNSYRCLRCGHTGSEAAYDEGQPAARICAGCGSYEIEPCAAPPEGRPVPLRVLRSAEAQALHWKRQAEALSRLVRQAITNGHMGAPYAGEAQKIVCAHGISSA